jgi:hypothetical protein
VRLVQRHTYIVHSRFAPKKIAFAIDSLLGRLMYRQPKVELFSKVIKVELVMCLSCLG